MKLNITSSAVASALLLLSAIGIGPDTAQAQSAVESATVRSATSPAALRAGTATRAPARRAAAAAPAAPAPVAPDADAGPSCEGGLPEPVPIRISAGKSMLVNLPEPVTRRTLGDAGIVEARLVSPQVLYLVSNRVGATNAILQGRSGACTLLDIVVGVDTDSVRAKINELLPSQKNIRVSSGADSIVLAGTVSDALAAERAVAIANAFVRSSYQQGIDGAGGESGSGRSGGEKAEVGGAPMRSRVVNMLGVSSSQQVMLEVKIAEVSKQLLDRVGTQFAASRTNGSWSYSLLSGFLTGTAGGAGTAFKDALNNLAIEAEKGDGMVRILAEPNVMAISGQEGSFLAGGRILIPVSQNNANGAMTITLEEKEFGVGLKFVPTVLEDGRINLQVAPEVSELSRDGVGISATGITARSVFPLITTRRASTTVQLYDGQSFAIGGLIKNNVTTNIKAFPLLGEIPVLGALFRSSDFQSEKTELVFIVTPRLVKPLPPDYVLPTDLIGEANRQAVFVDGRLDSEGARAPAATAPARPGGFQLK